MGEERQVKRSRSRRWAIAAVAVLAAAAVGGGIVFSWARPRVRWRQVLAAVGQQDTIHGQARIYLPDGSQWEYALWAKVKGPGKTAVNGALRPVRLPPGRSTLPAHPDPMLKAFCDALDVCGKQGIITLLAAGGTGSPRARRIEWAGKPALMVDMATPAKLASDRQPHLDEWRLVLDPDSRLVLAVSLFAREGGESVMRARCGYEYNAWLPAGFKDQP